MSVRILIDGIVVSHPQPGGYRTYATNLIENLTTVDKTNEYLLAIDRPINLPAGDRRRDIVLGRPGSLGVVWREQVQIARLAARERVALLHALAATAGVYSSVPLVLTLYDTIELTDPLPSPLETKRWAMRVYSRAVQRRAARRAAHILTISQYSKRQIMRHHGIDARCITVTPLAPNAACHSLDRNYAVRQIENLHGVSQFVLGIASAVHRKNSRGLIAAYAALPLGLRRAHPLVLVCTHHVRREALVDELLVADRDGDIVFLESVTDDELVLLYNAAAAFVFPSLEEGFGLPPLEAMACGAPVIASNSSSLPEVLGDAGILVSPGDTGALRDALGEVLADQRLAESLRGKGLARAQLFSWKQTVLQTLEVYRSVADRSRQSTLP